MEKYYDSEADIVTIMEDGYGRSLDRAVEERSINRLP